MPVAHGATVTVGAEAANARPVTIQLTDANRQPMTSRAIVGLFVSSDAAGLEPVDFSTDDTVPTVGTKGAALGGGLDSEFRAVSAADGIVDLVLTNASDQGKTRYLTVEVAGRLLDPVAVAFIDNP